jgi:hypothetical protein
MLAVVEVLITAKPSPKLEKDHSTLELPCYH